MASITLSAVCEIADDDAFESRRPWRVKELREKAFKAWRTVPRRDARMGLSHEQVYGRMRRSIYEQVLKASREMDALLPSQRQPTAEQIDAALQAFTPDQWKILVKDLEQEEGYHLEKYIDSTDTDGCKARYERLKREIGTKKLHAILAAVVQRGLELWSRNDRPKLVAISDVYWAVTLPDLASEANLARVANGEGLEPSAKGGSVAELGSDRSIARLLSKRDEQTGREMAVSRDDIKRWRKLQARVPFEQYAADKTADEVKSGAARIAYWAMVHKKYQRKH